MKIETNVNSVVSGALETAKVTVNYNAALADLLSNKIYTDVVSAPIRELASNAADHHTKHGIHRPFDVHVPSHDEPWFSVRNFGPAMSHDFVMNNYSQFGLSDKATSDVLIGGMGVGSKSPLAYTDSFVITTWQDGVQRIYVCGKTAEGPTIYLMDSVSAPPPVENGTEIRFEVGTDDVGDFRNAARTILSVFDPLPNTLSFDMSPIEKILENKYGYTYGGYSSNLFVQMGPVLYSTSVPVPRGIASKIVLKFDIGELPVQASREAVQNDAETNEKIKAKYEKFVVGVKADFDEQFPPHSHSFYQRTLAFERSVAFKQSVLFGQIFVDNAGNPIDPHIWFSRRVSYGCQKSSALAFSVLVVTSREIPKELTWSELADRGHYCHRHTNMTMVRVPLNAKGIAFLVMDSKKPTRPCFFQHLFSNHERVYVIQADTLFGHGGQFTESSHFSFGKRSDGFFRNFEDFKEWACGIPVYRASVDAVRVQITPPVETSPETFEYKDYYGTPRTGKVSDFKETDVIYVRKNDILAFDPTVPKDSELKEPLHVDVSAVVDYPNHMVYRVTLQTWKKIAPAYKGKHFFEELRNKKLDVAEEMFFEEYAYLSHVAYRSRLATRALDYLKKANPDVVKTYSDRRKEFVETYKKEIDFLTVSEIKTILSVTPSKTIKYIFQLWCSAQEKETTSC